MIQNGIFVSHRGQSLCCVNWDKHLDMNPKEFWEGSIRKSALDKMNSNQPVKGCDVCYNKEKNKVTSDRHYWNVHKDIPTKKLPTILDLDLSNLCNLKCVMCDASRSSQHAKDKGLGVSAISRQYIESLLEISEELRLVTIQGGEPSIMEEFIYYFGELHKKGTCKNIDLQIITNLTNLNTKFLAILPYFKSVRLSISVDAYGTANDYIRWPSKFNSIEKNISKIIGIDTIKVVEIHNALNILSLFNFKDFLFWTKKIEKMFENTDKDFAFVPLKVFNPSHFSPFNAPESLKEKFFADVKSFFDAENFGKFSKTKVEIMLLCKKIKDSITDPLQLDHLVKEIQRLDRERSVKIQDYIPDFDKHIQKSQ